MSAAGAGPSTAEPASAPGATGSDRTLERDVAAMGRLAGAALGSVAAMLIGLMALNVFVLGPRLDRAVEATSVARLAHEALVDQQTGVRGYLLSGDRRYLEAYDRGLLALPSLNARVSELVPVAGQSGRLLVEVRVAQQDWADWALTVIADRRSIDGGAAATASLLAVDKAKFDVYRDRYEGLIGWLVTSRRSALTSQRTATEAVIAAALTVLIAAGAVTRRRLRALRRATATPVSRLIERLARIEAGDLAPQPLDGGPAELRQIGRGIEAMASSLSVARNDAEARARALQAQSRRQGEVLLLAREVAGSLSLRYVLRSICLHVRQVTDGAQVTVWMLDWSRSRLEVHADSDGPDCAPVARPPIALGQGAVGRAAQLGRVDDASEGEPTGTGPAEATLAVPMVVGAEVIGVIELRGLPVASLSREVTEIVETMAVHAATALASARLHEHTAELAVTDALTSLPNRRRLDEDLAAEVTAGSRYLRPMAFLMIDVDHFKAYNDSFGHQEGDVALQTVSRLLRTGLRPTDRAYRYGGEEFALILRETTREEAMSLADRIRARVEHHFSAPGLPRPVTLSIGVSGFPENGPSPSSVVLAADEALYRAKHGGRNRVAEATPESATPMRAARSERQG